MASKFFNINFNIAAKLASSYVGSFQNASAAVWKLGEASKETARVSEAVNAAYSKGVIGANSYANAVLNLSNNMARMRFDTYSMKMAQHAANFLMIKNAAGYRCMMLQIWSIVKLYRELHFISGTEGSSHRTSRG